MRIISGEHKGRTIQVRKNFDARPTTDYAKESIFNIINNHFDFDVIEVLDLFSGTGSISYEFASRGSKRIVSVEKDAQSAKFIKQNTILLKIDSIEICKADAFWFIEKCRNKFDIIFADPPYELPNLQDIPDAVLKADLLKDDGWFILEHGKQNTFEHNPLLIDKRTYGSVHFSIFKKL